MTPLRQTGDPDMALNNLERFLGSLNFSEGGVVDIGTMRRILPPLIVLFGGSQFLSSFCVVHAEQFVRLLSNSDVLACPARQQTLVVRLREMSKAVSTEEELFRAFRLFRKGELLRIGMRDLLGKTDLAETVSELTLLAEVCLQEAYARTDERLRAKHGRPLVLRDDGTTEAAGFSVIAMGKLGGGELNFSSDVDLMFVYSADGETEGTPAGDGSVANRITNHQYFVKLAEQISSLIGKNTADGFVFRVDLRLRPEGQQGPLAQSLGGYEIYYESWGQTWERSALIKARPVAGDPSVGKEFLERILPFVYRKYLDFGAIVEIRDMKQKINREVQLKGKANRDVKLGYGGIREIEFLVQAPQLIYGGRDRMLRERGTMKTLHTLAQKGLLTYEETGELSKAYVFLRTLEHRLQILNDQQTQVLPTGNEELRTLARRMGYVEAGRESEQLLRDFGEHTRRVRNIYDRMLAQAADAQTGQDHDDFAVLIYPDIAEQDALGILQRYGFRDPGKAFRNIVLLREGEAFVHQTPRSRRAFSELFPQLFREIIASPDPDRALNHLESYLAAQGSWDTFQAFVQQDSRLLSLMMSVFGASDHFSRMLVRTPSLLLDLLETGSRTVGTTKAYRKSLALAMEKGRTIADKLDALRRFKKREELRIGMADLTGSMSFRAVCRNLSLLAEICLDGAFRLACGETAKRFGGAEDDAGSGMAIIGAGKLGGRELIYGSDLDILFIYDHDGTPVSGTPAGMSSLEYVTKIAEKTISFLTTMTREGAAYRVDTRLRPAGSKGPLVSTLAGFVGYLAENAETWERQAMINTRLVAGDGRVGKAAIDALREGNFRREDPAGLAAAVDGMRRRMEAELGKENDQSFNVKQGVGGLVDIEFLVQYLQLRHGAEHRRVRLPGTMNGVQILAREGLLSMADRAGLLEAYRFLRRLESGMRIVSNLDEKALSRDPLKLGPLARRLGYRDEPGQPAGKTLLDEYARTRRTVRLLYERGIAC